MSPTLRATLLRLGIMKYDRVRWKNLDGNAKEQIQVLYALFHFYTVKWVGNTVKSFKSMKLDIFKC